MTEKNNWINEEIESAHNPESDVYYKEFLYVPLEKIVGNRDGKWEHQEVYDVDNEQDYYFSFRPVGVTKVGNKYEFYDGFHRVNFCRKHGLDVPAIIYTAKAKTHNHTKRLGTLSLRYRIFDKDCEKDLAKSQLIKCRKHLNRVGG